MLQTTASALETALNRKYHHTRLPTCQYLLPLQWWFHICSPCILSTLPRLSLSGDWRVSRMQNEKREYTDHLILWKTNPTLDWVVSDLQACGFVCCCQQQTVRSHHRLPSCQSRGLELTAGGSGRWTTENRKKGLDLRSRMADEH